MKLSKIICTVSSIPLAGLAFASVSSCRCSPDIVFTDQAEFIHDRSFTIRGVGESGTCYGTGWIVSDATESTTDYTYWMATNWHVIHGMETVSASKYQYSDANTSGYRDFALFQPENLNNFLYDSITPTTYYKPGIDFYVAKVNFGNPTGSIKTKLDKLNKLQAEKGYINQFATTATEALSGNKYLGGFPYSSSSKRGLWEYHTISASNLQWYVIEKIYSGKNKGHAIGNPDKNQDGSAITGGTKPKEQFYYYDVAPQLMMKTSVGVSYMSGGASGSMLLNSDNKICGIYWGGWGSETTFYPSFSFIYDFVSGYLPN